MATKTHDLAVKLGEYTDRQGQSKGRWQNVGAVLQDSNGGEFILLERTFNPAGMPNPDGKTSVAISKFPVGQRDGQGGGQSGQGSAPTGGQGGGQAPPSQPPDSGENDIPF